MIAQNTPRLLLKDEYEKYIDLLERTYSITRQHFNSYYPNTKENYCDIDKHYVIETDGKIVSHVGLTSMPIYADGCEILGGGIGGVATDPDYRSQGYMSTLMKYVGQTMHELDMPISILWGYTDRYRHFGYERAGRELVFQTRHASFKDVKPESGLRLRGITKNDLKSIDAIHKQEQYHVLRPSQVWRDRLAIPHYQTWMAEKGDELAYFTLSGNSIVECGGKAEFLIEALAYLLGTYNLGQCELNLPAVDSQLTHLLCQHSQSWHYQPLGMIKINNLVKLLSCYKKLIEKRCLDYGVTNETITFEMSDSRQMATITLGECVQVQSGGGAPIISRSDIEMVRLLFGSYIGDLGIDSKQRRLLRLLFPLDLYVWRLDHV